MIWNPDIYNEYKSKRAEPFYDAMKLIRVGSGMKVIDLGCGTGELTVELNKYLPGSKVLGIDSSAEMLQNQITTETGDLSFRIRSIEEQLVRDEKFDLVFSNAALQWLPDHLILFPRILNMLNPGGQLIVQMPAQSANITNFLLEELASQPPFKDILKDWTRQSPVKGTETYAKLFYEKGGMDLQIIEKIYPLIMKDAGELFNWVSGTALLPYLDRLDAGHRSLFSDAYKRQLAEHFSSDPVFYPFKRILLSAVFP